MSSDWQAELRRALDPEPRVRWGQADDGPSHDVPAAPTSAAGCLAHGVDPAVRIAPVAVSPAAPAQQTSGWDPYPSGQSPVADSSAAVGGTAHLQPQNLAGYPPEPQQPPSPVMYDRDQWTALGAASPAPSASPAVPTPVTGDGAEPADASGGAYQPRHARVHGDPAWRRARDAARAVVGWQASREVADVAAAAQHANQPITTGRRIAVVSVRGGAGKSTVSALLATTLAGLRPDPVLAVDADPEPGSLPLRLGPLGAAVRTGGDRGIGEVSEFDRVASALQRTQTGVWLWRDAYASSLQRLDELAAAKLLRDRQRFLSRFFAVQLTDCGPGLGGAGNHTVIADAHTVVVAGTATLDGVHGVDTGLQRLLIDGGPQLLARCVVVLTTTVAGPLGVDLDDAVARLSRYGPAVLVLPHDRQLALGAAIDVARLSVGVRQESVRIAAAVMDRAVRA
ncbi:MinD/ParA family protein [Krasilnikovia sp. MM14-A1259]|uniref:MinD/ParA family ATP-binding protein n=1 Tax=Krasilnikovia sp. MM14-A1259 TaxID=3373539 RepID=UPI00399CF677